MKKFIVFCCIITVAHTKHFDEVFESINSNFNDQLHSISGDISQLETAVQVTDLSENRIETFNQSQNASDDLSCFQCHYPHIRGFEAKCRERVGRCFPRFERNVTSCVSVTYEHFGLTYTFKDCFNKMPLDEGLLKLEE